jgi:Na+/H+ antiporter NhaD/arsenite permease-like protein
VELTHYFLDRFRGPHSLLAVVVLLSGLLSAFLVNDVVCLALTPLVLHLTRRLRLDPLPYLIALATAANVGSTGTITGNPQNMIIGSKSHIGYLRFAARLMPVALLGLGINYLVVAVVYRKRLRRTPEPTPKKNAKTLEDGARMDADRAQRRIESTAHVWLRRKSMATTLVVVALFFTGLPIALIALGGAAFLLLSRMRPEKIYHRIDWGLLIMFTGLFIVVHAFQVHVVNGWGIEHWTFLTQHPVDLLSVISAGLSNLVSNVPAVLLFGPVVEAMPVANQETAWLALAMSSTFAGNLTVLGSVANLIVVENARKEDVAISFWEYGKVGIPVTLLTLGLGIAWLKFVPY